MKWLLPVALTLGAAAILAAQRNSAGSIGTIFVPGDGGADASTVPDQGPTLLDELSVTFNPLTYIPPSVDQSTSDANLKAFEDMLGFSEGATYNTLVGGGTFDSYTDHPNVLVDLGHGLKSTAAGKYQILYRTWAPIKRKLGLPDFSPASQDAACVELLSEYGALRDVQAGNFAAAVAKVNKCWASLPGSPYGQPTHPLETLLAFYTQAGGTDAESQA